MEIAIELLKIGRIAAKENTRYAIGCTRIVQKKRCCSIMSTDGKCLLLAEWESENKQPNIDALIPASYLAAVLKLRTAAERSTPEHHRLIAQFDGRNFKLKGDRRIDAVPHTKEEGPFPDMDYIVNDARGKVDNLYLSPRPLLQLLTVMDQLVHSNFQPTFQFTAGQQKSSPVILYGRTESNVKLTGVICPCNGP